jgi:hypothetical protein
MPKPEGREGEPNARALPPEGPDTRQVVREIQQTMATGEIVILPSFVVTQYLPRRVAQNRSGIADAVRLEVLPRLATSFARLDGDPAIGSQVADDEVTVIRQGIGGNSGPALDRAPGDSRAPRAPALQARRTGPSSGARPTIARCLEGSDHRQTSSCCRRSTGDTGLSTRGPVKARR